MKQVLRKYYYRSVYKNEISKFKKNERNVILIGTPNHGNLGDHAIASAEVKMLLDIGVSKEYIIEITSDFYLSNTNQIDSLIKEKDIICITGGGFLGSLWVNEEKLVRDIFTKFEKNKIIIFPQTIFYENTIEGKKQLSISKQVYSEHQGPSAIFLRDQTSYELVKTEFLDFFDKIFYSPDIVLYLDEYKEGIERKNQILCCFRSDKEKHGTVNKKEYFKDFFNNYYCVKENVVFTDTVISERVNISSRIQKLSEKYQEFQESKLVVTDRLHGMIFSVITRTPCIAFNNTSGKVKGVYSWINNLENITFLEDVPNDKEQISTLIENMLSKEKNVLYHNILVEEFKQMKRELKGFLNDK